MIASRAVPTLAAKPIIDLSHHPHVVTADIWDTERLLRDHLRANPQAAAEYAGLKRRLAAAGHAACRWSPYGRRERPTTPPRRFTSDLQVAAAIVRGMKTKTITLTAALLAAVGLAPAAVAASQDGGAHVLAADGEGEYDIKDVPHALLKR
ncbi:GrpB family protein [Nonomuraea sp. SYSU D8015]|uniref:GrpB family protein n=1 Tax=Nonomuraea sp. SYSU D8015 TaxID=2593644 RepID=UPI001660DB4C|nr:GrpB family protein [Nonomuraea sp. SYSU D8015]